MTMQTPKFITITEAADILGVSATTVRRRVKDGSLKAEKMGPNGTQYFIDPEELKISMEMVNVVPVKREVGMKELTGLFKQAMQDALIPLQSELMETKTMLTAERIRQTQNEKALKQEMATLNASIKTIEATLQDAVRSTETTLQVTVKDTVITLQDTVSSIEARQVERESSHYDRVDERLNELSSEIKKGFLAKLFKK